jgi:phosphate transport system substrate-binding protein
VTGTLLLAVLAAGCARKGSVTLAGSTAFQPFAEKLADMFMAQTPHVNVLVQGGGSAVGIQSARQGNAQIGMADLVELPPEAQALTATVVARDGVVVVVNPANAVSNLTMSEVRAIFDGTFKKWSEVGGPDADINVVSREAGSGTRSSFEKIVGISRLSASALVQDSSGTIRETVANDPRAVGYLSHGLVNERVKGLSIEGVAGTTEAAMTGQYKLVRPVYFLTREPVAETTRQFIAFVLSPAGQEQIRKDGLIPAQ